MCVVFQVRGEHGQLERQLKEKRRSFDEEGATLKGEDFKRYVIKLRSKGNAYKAKREEIAQLQAEYVTLKRSEEIIKRKYDSIREHLVSARHLRMGLFFQQLFSSHIRRHMHPKILLRFKFGLEFLSF
jgi:hypothetical protein